MNPADELLHKAAEAGELDAAKAAVAAGANLESQNAVSMTALTNAALAGQFHVAQFLIDSGAQVTNDLVSSLSMKIGILKENNEAGMVTDEGLEEWSRFYRFIRRARLKQDLPKIFEALAAGSGEAFTEALDAIETAANAGFDIAPAIPALASAVSSGSDKDRATAAAALAVFYIRTETWPDLSRLAASEDEGISLSVMSGLVAASKNQADLTPLLPSIIAYLGHPSEDVRHDAPIVIGYLATNGFDASAAVAPLQPLLAEPAADMRQIGLWAYYRLKKYGKVNIDGVMPRICELAEDPEASVASLASEVLAL